MQVFFEKVAAFGAAVTVVYAEHGAVVYALGLKVLKTLLGVEKD